MSEESKDDVVQADDQIALIEARLAGLTGLCGDHSCVFGPPKGLGTNGGCRCEVKRNPKVQQAIQLQRKLSALLRERVDTQAESITTFQSQLRVMKEAIEEASEVLALLVPSERVQVYMGSKYPKSTHAATIQRAGRAINQLRSAITPKGTN